MGRGGRENAALMSAAIAAIPRHNPEFWPSVKNNAPTTAEISILLGNSANKKSLLEKVNPDLLRSLGWSAKADDLNKALRDNWDWEKMRPIMRSMWQESDKCNSSDYYRNLLEETDKLAKDLGFNRNTKFDRFQASDAETRLARSETVSADDIRNHGLMAQEMAVARRYRQQRNDYIEALMFEEHEDVVPAFANKRKHLDMFAGDKPFDQKVTTVPEGLERDLRQEHGDDYDCVAHLRDNPKQLARWFYENQGADSFGTESRLFVVLLGDDSPAAIKEAVQNAEVDKMINVDFNYKGKDKRGQDHSGSYKTKAAVIFVGDDS